MHLLLQHSLSLSPTRCRQLHHPPWKYKAEQSPGKASWGRSLEASSHFTGWSKVIALSAIFKPTVYTRHTSLICCIFWVYLRANLAVKSRTGGCMQLAMCSAALGKPLFGDRVNLFSRLSYHLCSYFCLAILSTVLIHFQVQKQGWLIFKSLDFPSIFSIKSQCCLCLFPVPQDFPVFWVLKDNC